MTRKIPTERLREWYLAARRQLPWRAAPGHFSPPYHVWLSEVMLQQTTVATVIPYFQQFLRTWPRISDLAAADREAVLVAWQGLGYYARARNLHRCAQQIAAQYDGVFPQDAATIRALPGIGPYTADAIRAMAFGVPVVPVDGNIERVTARLFCVDAPLPGAKKRLQAQAQSIISAPYPGDVAQALMDLGARICVPRAPKCDSCPLQPHCQAYAVGRAAELPRKSPKKARPHRYGTAFWLRSDGGKVWLRRRPDRGLLGGMTEVPTTPWVDMATHRSSQASGIHAPAACDWRPLKQEVQHQFTHFRLTLAVWTGEVPESLPIAGEGFWVPMAELSGRALPTVMKKVAAVAMQAA